MVTASRTTAVFVDGSGVVSVLFVQEIHLTVPCEQVTVTSVSRGHYAVKEVYTSVYSLNYVLRCTYSHEVTGLILGHIRLYSLDYAVHFLCFFTYRKTAYSVSVGVKLSYLLHVTNSEVCVCASLVDTEKKLVRVYGSLEIVESVKLCLASEKPSCGSVAGVFNVIVFGGVFNALVKCHSDSGAEVRLNLHGLLGTHEYSLTVYVGGKVYTLLLYTAKTCKGEYLESATVCKARSVPTRKLLKSAHLTNKTVSGTNV